MTLPSLRKYPGLLPNLAVVVLVMALQPLLRYVYDFPVAEAQYDGSLLLTALFGFKKRIMLALGLLLVAAAALTVYRPVRFQDIGRLSRYLFSVRHPHPDLHHRRDGL